MAGGGDTGGAFILTVGMVEWVVRGGGAVLAGLARERLQGSLHSISVEAFPFIQAEFPRFQLLDGWALEAKGAKRNLSRVC